MKTEYEIDLYELIKFINPLTNLASIIKDLNPDESDILEYMSIESLVESAYNDDPDQVRENLLAIMDLNEEITIEKAFQQFDFTHIITKMNSINSIGLLRVLKELSIIDHASIPKSCYEPLGFAALSQYIKDCSEKLDIHEIMKTIKSALRNEVTILYEVK